MKLLLTRFWGHSNLSELYGCVKVKDQIFSRGPEFFSQLVLETCCMTHKNLFEKSSFCCKISLVTLSQNWKVGRENFILLYMLFYNPYTIFRSFWKNNTCHLRAAAVSLLRHRGDGAYIELFMKATAIVDRSSSANSPTPFWTFFQTRSGCRGTSCYF